MGAVHCVHAILGACCPCWHCGDTLLLQRGRSIPSTAATHPEETWLPRRARHGAACCKKQRACCRPPTASMACRFFAAGAAAAAVAGLAASTGSVHMRLQCCTVMSCWLSMIADKPAQQKGLLSITIAPALQDVPRVNHPTDDTPALQDVGRRNKCRSFPNRDIICQCYWLRVPRPKGAPMCM